MRAKLYSRFEILQSRPAFAVEALKREIERQPPAYEAGGSGCGARDVAIWLTVLEALRHEEVYFVARDKRAYGEKTLSAVLQQEADSVRPQGLRFCPEVTELLGQLAESQEITVDQILHLADDVRVHAVVETALKGIEALGQLIAYVPKTYVFESVWVARTEPRVQACDASGMKAYRIGDRLWACSRVWWKVQQTVTQEQATPNYWNVHAEIPSTILFEIDEAGNVIDAQVLAVGRYQLVRIEQWGSASAVEDFALSKDSVSRGLVGPQSVHDESRTDDSVSGGLVGLDSVREESRTDDSIA